MNRERAKELLPIIQAFAEGKAIETLSNLDNSWNRDHHNNLDFGLAPNRYRIAPEKTFVPYSFDDMLVGKIVERKDSKARFMITGQSMFDVWISSSKDSISYEYLFKLYENFDGSPCGKLQS